MRIIIFLIIAILCVNQSFAGVRFVDPKLGNKYTHIRDYGHIEIIGEITSQDVKVLPSAIDQFNRYRLKKGQSKLVQLLVFLNSGGGSVKAAIEIGKLLRQHTAHVVVDNGSECSSACIFILAGGVERDTLIGSSLGLHRPVFDKELFAGLNAGEASVLYNSMIEMCRNYLSVMGIRDKLFDDMLRVPSHKVRYEGTDYAFTVGLHGSDPGYQEWDRAKTEQKIGKDKMKLRDLYIECLNSGAANSFCDKQYGAGIR